jgi:photosystem II stability/assembly factor-like uncharacterized protein
MHDMLKLLTKTFFVAVLLVCHLVAHAEDRHWIQLGPEASEVEIIAVDPTTPQIVYAGTHDYGFFKSTTGGSSWDQIGKNAGITRVSALAIDPLFPQTIYAGAYANVNKSTDGGMNWTSLDLSWSIGDGLGDVIALAINPVDPQTIYAAAGYYLFKSTDGGVTWNKVFQASWSISALAINPGAPQTIYVGEYGSVYKSTDDGIHWDEINSGLPLARIFTLAVDPDAGSVYAGTEIGVYRLANGSDAWVEAGLEDFHVWDLAVDPAMPQTLYAGTSSGVFRSTNSGNGWIRIMAAEIGAEGLAIASSAPQILYAVKIGFGVQKSMDWGSTWTAKNNGLLTDHMYTVSVDPTNPQTLYSGGMGGFYKSTNAGIDWQPLDYFIHPEKLWIDPESPNNMYALDTGSIFRSTNSGAGWTRLVDFMGDILVVDPKAPETLYAVDSASSFTRRLFKSTDSGVTWNPTSGGLPDEVSALAVDPANPQTLYATICYTAGVYKSTDGGNSWNLINTNLPPTLTLAINPKDPNTIYAGTNWNGVYKSEDAGIHWNATNNGLPHIGVPILAINPGAPETLYVVLDDIGSTVYESTDGGDSWGRISDGLSASNIMGLAIDPAPPHILYVSAFKGGVWAYTPEPPKMILETVDPSMATAGGAAFTITIRGRNFPADAAVLWDGLALATEYVNTFQLNAMIPANLISTSGAANITVSAESQSSAIFGFYIQPSLVSATLTTNPAGLSFAVDGVTYATAQTFSWEQGSSHTISVTSPQAGSGGTRYVFANWSDGGAIRHTITVPATATTFTANFTTQYRLTMAASPSGGGSISASPASDDGYYNAGSSVQLTATANSGYSFSGWSGALTGAVNPKSITMSEPRTVGATFLRAGTRPSRAPTVLPTRTIRKRDRYNRGD